MKARSQFMSMSTLFGVLLLACAMLSPALSWADACSPEQAVKSGSTTEIYEIQSCLSPGASSILVSYTSSPFDAANIGVSLYLYDSSNNLVWSQTNYWANGGYISTPVTPAGYSESKSYTLKSDAYYSTSQNGDCVDGPNYCHWIETAMDSVSN